MSFQQAYGGYQRKPGIDPVVETFENEFLWGFWDAQFFSGLVIDGAARDVGNTNFTTILRSGLLLGQVTATRELTAWAPTAVNGSQFIWGILKESRNLQTNSTDVDRFSGPIVVGGGLLADRIIIPGTTTPGIVGNVLEFEVRKQLSRNFKLNDDYQIVRPPGFWDRVITGTEQGSGITLTAAESGTNCINTGGTLAVTMPEPLKGVQFKFTSLDASTGSTITLTAASGTPFVTPGIAAAATLVVQTEVNTVYGTGTQWIVEGLLS